MDLIMIVQWCKTQIMAAMVLAYVAFLYIRESRSLNRRVEKPYSNRMFQMILWASGFAVLFDGVTACTVNLTDVVPIGVNLRLHFGMYASYEIFMALVFWYWLSVTMGVPGGNRVRIAAVCFNALVLITTAFLMNGVEFIPGKIVSYSMGAAVYVCYGSVLLHCALTCALLLMLHHEVPRQKKAALFATVFIITAIMSLQFAFPETLVSCMAVVMVPLSIYLNMENPTIRGLEHYRNEMAMGFATLVENKDGNTGGHIRRSSAYVRLIVQNLKKNRKYRTILTRDYVNRIERAAPMHDIGKIAIPDAVLQKPGKLTPEEFAIMKNHSAIGGQIIHETFGHLLDEDYETMAFQVARFHHEKWNGTGYPDGLKGEQIPLCARIMAVADVFDAISSCRCYRAAMPLETCYDIIRRGRGTDFDPDIVDAFFSDLSRVEHICTGMNDADTIQAK